MDEEDKGGAAEKLREFFDATMRAFNQYLVKQWKPEIGEVGPSDFPFLTHPKKGNEVVATMMKDRKVIFSTAFVEECLGESKENGRNELLNYLYGKFGEA